MTPFARVRADRSMTLEEVAARAGVSMGTAERLEQGAVPSVPVGLRVARSLATTVEHLWGSSAERRYPRRQRRHTESAAQPAA